MLSHRISHIDSKRERFIAIGKARVRVPNDLHIRLTQFCQSRRYSKTFDGLLYVASVGLSVLENAERINVIKVDRSDQS